MPRAVHRYHLRMLVVHSGQEIEQDHTGALPIRMIQISRFLLAAHSVTLRRVDSCCAAVIASPAY